MPTKPGARPRKYMRQPTTKVGTKMQSRVRSKSEYHTHRWTKASRVFRMANPFCISCLLKGIMAPTEVTNHIIPTDIHPDFWAVNNREPLCKRCNIIQGNTDKQLIAQVRAGKVNQQQLETIRAKRVEKIKAEYNKLQLIFVQL